MFKMNLNSLPKELYIKIFEFMDEDEIYKDGIYRVSLVFAIMFKYYIRRYLFAKLCKDISFKDYSMMKFAKGRRMYDIILIL